jgi:hypothetical protein
MSQVESDCVRERLDRLERDNRRLIGILVIVVLGALVAVVEGSGFIRTHSKVIEAENFIVRDASGVVRASVGLRKDGTPEIALHDSKGNYQFAVETHSDDTAYMSFYDRADLRAMLFTAADGSGYLKFYDAEGTEASSLYHLPNRETGLTLDNGRSGMHLSVKRDATPQLCVSSDKENRCEGVQVRSDSSRLRMAP